MKLHTSALVGIILLILVLTMGCTVNTHDRHSQVIITEKFSQSQVPVLMAPLFKSNPEMWYYDYFIRYTEGGIQKVDRVSKDVYASVFEGRTYILKWGYINDATDITDEYGYVEVILMVSAE